MEIDFDKYDYTRVIQPWCVDERHTNILFNVMMRCDFRKVLELGCLDGSTAVAYIEALDHGKDFELHLCDVEIRPALRRLVDGCSRRDRIVLRQGLSWDAIDPTFDFVFVDADHRLDGAVRDLVRLLECDIPTVAAHDVTATVNGFGSCEGAQLLGNVYSRLNGYWHCIDCESRPDELTQRGLLVATRDASIHHTISDVFADWT